MIVDKKTGQITSGNNTSSTKKPDPIPVDKTEIVQVASGGIIDAYKAIVEILSNIRWRYGDNSSEKIFNRVYLDDGQFNRIVKNGINLEDGIAFPACFVHFINIHWLKPSGKTVEGRAELRIRFILNRLNIHDSVDTECEGFYVAERIKQEIELHKDEYEALKERCALDYIDQVNSFDKGLQPWWMNFEVWFKTSNIWWQRNITQRYLVFPPFANHADQEKEHNKDNHNNLDHPATYDEQSKFAYSGIEPPSDDNNTDDSGDEETGE